MALVIPVTSYMLYMRYVTESIEIYTAARYIKEELSAQVPGGLDWESWRRGPGGRTALVARTTLLMMFIGPSLLGLGWAFVPAFLSPRLSISEHAALVAVWLVGLASVFHEWYLIVKWYDRAISWPPRRQPSGPEVTAAVSTSPAEQHPSGG